MINPSAPPRRTLQSIETSSGEIEQERLPRRANAAEAVFVYLLMHTALLTGIGVPRQAGEAPWVQGAGLALVGLLGIYMVAVAHRIHGDSRRGRGLPEPLELFSLWPRRGLTFRLAVSALGLALPILLVWVGWSALLVRLGIRLTWPGVYEQLTSPPWNTAGAVLPAFAFGLVFSGFVIRWNNLASAARALTWPAGAILAGVVAAAASAAAVSGDWARFLAFTWTGGGGTAFLPRLAAYLPWALLQQWLLLAYFNTRIRKAVPAAGCAGVPGRAVTAGLTGIAFGALHWPNVPLVVLTCAGGCVSGWLFQQDRSRNLFLLGLVHAVAGALLAALTTVRMGVGPRL